MDHQVEIAQCRDIKTGLTIGMPYNPHPAADLFPVLEGAERQEMLDDILERGILEPIVVLDDMVLDGRNRYLIGREARVEIPYSVYDGDDPIGFVISRNLRRRHLTPSQKAMIAAKLAKMPVGRPSKILSGEGITAGHAAAALGVSKASVERAKAVQRDGTPELQEAITSGHIPLGEGLDYSKLPEDQQKAILAASKEIRTASKAESRRRRLLKLAEISGDGEQKTAGGVPKGFSVIYADPPWKNEVYSEETGSEKSPPYPYMEIDAICSLCSGDASPANDDAILYLWTTGNRIHLGLRVLEAWGFEFKTSWIWDKEKIGTGRYVRDRHEIILIGTRGKMPAPDPGLLPPSVHSEPRGEHSVKPEYFAEQIDRMYPGVPKLEMFARRQREGWVAWGFEA